VIKLVLRIVASLAGVAVLTIAGRHIVPVNVTSVAFAYLLLVLVIATWWGFVEASIASLAAAFAFNFFFLPPVGTLTIADPQNWVALFSFLITALIASRLSAKAERRALDAIEHRHDVERLYSFSRAILLIDRSQPFAKQLVTKLAEIFGATGVALYERRTGEIYRAGPAEFEELDNRLRDTATHGTTFSDPASGRVIAAVRLGSEPIASLALEGMRMPDAVLQGIGNLVAIGLERARAQDLEHQVEAARQSEQLRTTLIDAMAHELKTPLTSIKAATTALLAGTDRPAAASLELIEIADEEAEHLRQLIDDAIEMAQLDTGHIEIHPQRGDVGAIVREIAASMQDGAAGRPIEVICSDPLATIALDPRLVRLAVKQLVDNALKYSPPGTPVTVRASGTPDEVIVEVTDQGKGIPAAEQSRIFERFYRGAAVQRRIPGSGLGLSIAQSIVRAHNGDLTVRSRPGETVFRMTLPAGLNRGSQ
jgi:two-component system sensor histidine kinase KdpD